jgi:DNA-binding NarL/FixJ family response regulator
MLVYVLDPHVIYRQGVAACLSTVGIGDVVQADQPETALDHPRFHEAAVTIVDPWPFGGAPLVRRLAAAGPGRVIVCSGHREPADVLEVVRAGAIGYLWKETLTPDALAAGASAAAMGSGVLAPELLSDFMQGLARVSRDLLEPRGLSLSLLNEREQQILSCVAEGLPTREVACRLHFSERTVKNVLHDVVVKLNARSRSQAVAEAVRQGLI